MAEIKAASAGRQLLWTAMRSLQDCYVFSAIALRRSHGAFWHCRSSWQTPLYGSDDFNDVWRVSVSPHAGSCDCGNAHKVLSRVQGAPSVIAEQPVHSHLSHDRAAKSPETQHTADRAWLNGHNVALEHLSDWQCSLAGAVQQAVAKIYGFASEVNHQQCKQMRIARQSPRLRRPSCGWAERQVRLRSPLLQQASASSCSSPAFCNCKGKQP